MTRHTQKWIFVAALAVLGWASHVRAQQPMLPPIPPSTISPAPAPSPATMFGEGWPRPPEQPASLFRQAPTPMPYACDPLPGRYFERDPLLDPPSFPQPGFVADVELQVVVPHVYHDIVNATSVGPNNPPSTIDVPVTGFNWTVSPRIEAGYRLASGFGEFLISYQYIRTNGSGSTPFGPDGPASLHDKFEFNLNDLDYLSREFTPWKHWGMKWRFGLRQLHMFTNTTLTQPFDVASAGSGILSQTGNNAYHGYGAHIGVELERDFSQRLPGLGVIGKFDFGDTMGFIRQSVSQTMVDGTMINGVFRADQASPSVYGQVGVNYHPPGSRLDIYGGFAYGYWWNLGKFNNVALNAPGKPIAKEDLSLTSFNFRLSWNY